VREDHLPRRPRRQRTGELKQSARLVAEGDEDRPLGLGLTSIEGRVLVEDSSLELPECGAGLDAELRDEEHSRPPVDAERVGLAARSIEGEHQLSAQALSQRVRDDELRELGDDLRRPAEPQVCVDPQLDCRQAQLLETCDRRLRERLEPEIRERRPAPERERLAQDRRRVAKALFLQRLPPFAHEQLEAVEIELVAGGSDHVARPFGEQDTVRQHAAQSRDANLQRLPGRRGRARAPEVVDQPVGVNSFVRMEQEQREQRAFLGP
jgi:hypothetical protein